MNYRDIFSANLNDMNLPDVIPLTEDWTPISLRGGDKVRMTMQGLGKKELYLIEIIRK